MLRQRLSGRESYNKNPWDSTPKSTHSNVAQKSENMLISEWRLAFSGLVFSLIVIAAKLYFLNHEAIKSFILEPKLVSYSVLTEDGEVMYKYAWKTAVSYSNVWLPAFCGIVTTYFTWMMVYLDSSEPGVQPPSPFSPTKYKVRSGHSFHLNYVFAVVIGILVTIYMYWRQYSIEY